MTTKTTANTPSMIPSSTAAGSKLALSLNILLDGNDSNNVYTAKAVVPMCLMGLCLIQRATNVLLRHDGVCRHGDHGADYKNNDLFLDNYNRFERRASYMQLKDELLILQ